MAKKYRIPIEFEILASSLKAGLSKASSALKVFNSQLQTFSKQSVQIDKAGSEAYVQHVQNRVNAVQREHVLRMQLLNEWKTAVGSTRTQTVDTSSAAQAQAQKEIAIVKRAEQKKQDIRYQTRLKIHQINGDVLASEKLKQDRIVVLAKRAASQGSITQQEATRQIQVANDRKIQLEQEYQTKRQTLDSTASAKIAAERAAFDLRVARSSGNKEALLRAQNAQRIASYRSLLSQEKITKESADNAIRSSEARLQNDLIALRTKGAAAGTQAALKREAAELRASKIAAKAAGDEVRVAQIANKQKINMINQLAAKRLIDAKTAKKLAAEVAKSTTKSLSTIKAPNLQQLAGDLQGLGFRLGIIGAGMAAAVGAAVAPAFSLEKALSAVKAIAQPTAKDMEELSIQAIKLGRASVFTATEAATAQKLLAQAGFQTTEIIGALPEVLSLAAAGEIGLAEASNITATAIRGFQADITELPHMMDVLVQATTTSNSTVLELGESFKYVAPVAASAGLKFEDVVASLAKLHDAGIKSTMAGTSLRRAISAMISPTAAQDKILKKLNISLKDSEGNFVGYLPAIEKFQKALAGIEDPATRTGHVMSFFGQRAGPGMATLLGVGAEAIGEYSTALESAEGVAQRMAETRLANLSGAMLKLGQAVEGVTNLAILPLLGGLRKVVEWITKGITVFGDFIAKHEYLAKAIGVLTLAFGTLGVALAAFAGLALFVGTIGFIVGQMGTLTAALGVARTATLAYAASNAVLGNSMAGLSVGIFVSKLAAAGGALTGFFTLMKAGPLIITGFFQALAGGHTIAGAFSLAMTHAGIAAGGLTVTLGGVAAILGTIAVAAAAVISVFVAVKKATYDHAKAMGELGDQIGEAEKRAVSAKAKLDALGEPIGISQATESFRRLNEEQLKQLQILEELKGKHGEVAAAARARAGVAIEASKAERAEILKNQTAQLLAISAQQDVLMRQMAKNGVDITKDLGTAVIEFHARNPVAQMWGDDEEVDKAYETFLGLKAQVNQVEGAMLETRRSANDMFSAISEESKKVDFTKNFEDQVDQTDVVIKGLTGAFKRASEEISTDAARAAIGIEAIQDPLKREQATLELNIQTWKKRAELLTGGGAEVQTQAIEERVRAFLREREAGRLSAQDEQRLQKENLGVVQNLMGQRMASQQQMIDTLISEEERLKVAAIKAQQDLEVKIEQLATKRADLMKPANLSQEQNLEASQARMSDLWAKYNSAKASGDDAAAVRYREQLRTLSESVKEAADQSVASSLEALPASQREVALAMGESAQAAFYAWEEQDERQKERSKQSAGEIAQTRLESADSAANEAMSIWDQLAADEIAAQEKVANAQVQSVEQIKAAVVDLTTGLEATRTQMEGFLAILGADAESLALRFDTSAIDTAKEQVDTFFADVEASETAMKFAIKAFMGTEELTPDKMKDLFDLLTSGTTGTIKIDAGGGDTAGRWGGHVIAARMGGFIASMAKGGKLSGYGGGDIVNAKLEPGEFVARKEAVSKYGVGLFHLLNNLRLPDMSSILGKIKSFPNVTQHVPRMAYAEGGAVNGSAGTYSLALEVGGQSHELFGSQDQIEGLVEALRREGATSL